MFVKVSLICGKQKRVLLAVKQKQKKKKKKKEKRQTTCNPTKTKKTLITFYLYL